MTTMTSTKLADGRELLYFDEAEAAAVLHRDPSRTRDTRALDPRGSTGEARYDALSGEWVAIAAHRQSRTYLPPAGQCPLCPSTPGNRSEIPAAGYDVVVFENRFPSFGPALGPLPQASAPIPDGSHGVAEPAVGRCEVVAFTPEHHGSFGSLSHSRARTVIDAWAHRTEALSAMDGIRQVFCFENRGAEIGVTLPHPHGQIYAYPFVPPRALTLGRAARTYYDDVGGTDTLTASILRAERADGSRMIIEGEHFSAYVPFAARWPVEVHLTPHRQVPDLSGLTGDERDELAEIYLDVLGRLDRMYSTDLPYIAAWQQAPLDDLLRPAGYLHLQITSPRRAEDKLKFLAGSEAAMGAFINDTSPEQVAVRLRDLGGPVEFRPDAVVAGAVRQPAASAGATAAAEQRP